MVIVGTWVHGLFVVGQAPRRRDQPHLPMIRGKKAAVFATFALNPGKSLDKLTGDGAQAWCRRRRRARAQPMKLDEHSEIFAVDRLLSSLTTSI